jgi:hypothetical protein
MKTWVIAVIALGVLVVAGLPGLAVALAADDDTGREHVSHGQDRADAPGPKRDEVGKGHRAWKREVRGRRPGTAWRSLTPAQKARTAEKLAERSRTHAEGMQKWADCVATGRDDCVRPLPPGLAKRR